MEHVPDRRRCPSRSKHELQIEGVGQSDQRRDRRVWRIDAEETTHRLGREIRPPGQSRLRETDLSESFVERLHERVNLYDATLRGAELRA